MNSLLIKAHMDDLIPVADFYLVEEENDGLIRVSGEDPVEVMTANLAECGVGIDD